MGTGLERRKIPKIGEEGEADLRAHISEPNDADVRIVRLAGPKSAMAHRSKR